MMWLDSDFTERLGSRPDSLRSLFQAVQQHSTISS